MSFFCQFFCFRVRGINLVKIIRFRACPFGLSDACQLHFVHTVRHRYQMISLILHRLNLITGLFQLINCLPDSGPGYAKLIAQLLTGHISVRLTEQS